MAEQKPTKRRDELMDIEKSMQQFWEENKTYEVDAPTTTTSTPDNKYFTTFPYPYTNGKLHLGHAFSMTKAEYAARFHKLLGKQVLFPFGFHCTGMPMKASADKLKREIEVYGLENLRNGTANVPPGTVLQYYTMKKMDIPEDDIPKFQNPVHWLQFFPPMAVGDLKRFGVMVDFRRSFITTDVNPYYDAFVRWQFETLKQRNKISFGTRYSIYSPTDKQVCADHDRASGYEGIKPKDYTIVKIAVTEPYPAALKQFEGRPVYLAAATLRPETMFGQTNVWLKPEGPDAVYGAFEVFDKDNDNRSEVFICSEQSANNLSFQGYFGSAGAQKVTKLAEIKGMDLMGTKVRPPLSLNADRGVYVLPMLTIDMKKTTGVVTSVPSDSPDDYAAFMDLKNKPKMREKYNITDEMIMPYDVIPIIDIPEYGDLIAPTLVQKLKIRSQNDSSLLATAKDEAYSKGFNFGVMKGNCGKYAGMKVKDAKDQIKDDLISQHQAIPYSEPEKECISRSGDVCVVALVDQWFLNYGEESWRKQLEEYIREPANEQERTTKATFKTYISSTYKELADTVGWLKEWGCSRLFGLGSRLPWDERYLIESLSDSTIYMAYYTVCHILQDNLVLDGSKPNPKYNVLPEHVRNPDFWNYILQKGEYKGGNLPSEEVMKALRNEFEFWYPVDLRVSAKDLIKNHLTMALYNHAAIWPDEASTRWPRSYFTNGYINVDGLKMSKSLGNFMTMEQVVNKFSTDATRIALADAGDTHDDANFVELTANSAILRLHTHLDWIKKMFAAKGTDFFRTGSKAAFVDRVFESKMNQSIINARKAYESMQFRDALKYSLFDFEAIRDAYRVDSSEEKMHEELVFKWIEAITIMLAPITPHLSDYVYMKYLGHKNSLFDPQNGARFPEPGPIDEEALASDAYFRGIAHSFGTRLARDTKKAGQGKPNKAIVYVADKYSEWQAKCLKAMRMVLEEGLDVNDPKVVSKYLVKAELNPKLMKQAMTFVVTKQKEYAKNKDIKVLSDELPFDELTVLKSHKRGFCAHLTVSDIEFYTTSQDPATVPDPYNRLNMALPGDPEIAFVFATTTSQ